MSRVGRSLTFSAVGSAYPMCELEIKQFLQKGKTGREYGTPLKCAAKPAFMRENIMVREVGGCIV